VANLKPFTIDPQSRASHFGGYLVSVDYAPGFRGLIRRVHAERRILVADNGNFDRMATFLARMTPSVTPLAEARKREETVLGHDARPGDRA
jgi:hypothetical protein